MSNSYREPSPQQIALNVPLDEARQILAKSNSFSSRIVAQMVTDVLQLVAYKTDTGLGINLLELLKEAYTEIAATNAATAGALDTEDDFPPSELEKAIITNTRAAVAAFLVAVKAAHDCGSAVDSSVRRELDGNLLAKNINANEDYNAFRNAVSLVANYASTQGISQTDTPRLLKLLCDFQVKSNSKLPNYKPKHYEIVLSHNPILAAKVVDKTMTLSQHSQKDSQELLDLEELHDDIINNSTPIQDGGLLTSKKEPYAVLYYDALEKKALAAIAFVPEALSVLNHVKSAFPLDEDSPLNKAAALAFLFPPHVTPDTEPFVADAATYTRASMLDIASSMTDALLCQVLSSGDIAVLAFDSQRQAAIKGPRAFTLLHL